MLVFHIHVKCNIIMSPFPPSQRGARPRFRNSEKNKKRNVGEKSILIRFPYFSLKGEEENKPSFHFQY